MTFTGLWHLRDYRNPGLYLIELAARAGGEDICWIVAGIGIRPDAKPCEITAEVAENLRRDR